MPRLGLEWWKQELSLHPQELSELNQRILLPCWICVLSGRAVPGPGLSPVPRVGTETPSEDTRVKVVAQGQATGLSWLGLLVGQRRDINHKTRRRDQNVGFSVIFYLGEFPPSPPASLSCCIFLGNLMDKKRKLFILAALFSHFSLQCPARCSGLAPAAAVTVLGGKAGQQEKTQCSQCGTGEDSARGSQQCDNCLVFPVSTAGLAWGPIRGHPWSPSLVGTWVRC